MSLPKIVAEVMDRSPRTLSASDTARTAIDEMKRLDVDAVVVEHEGQLLGVLTDRDLLMDCVADGLDPNQTPLGAICKSNTPSLSPRDIVDNAATLMRDASVQRIPVVHDGHTVGLVSRADLHARGDKFSVLSQLTADSRARR